MSKLNNKKIACVATNGFEYSELTEPRKALKKEGAFVEIISLELGDIEGESNGKVAGKVTVDKKIEDANPLDYDGLFLPGGVKSPDTLRMSDEVIKFISDFVELQKPIAAICHGPWTLINAGGVDGKKLTSWPSIQVDLINAGAIWEDREVVRDGNLVTSRKPEDIPVFNREIIELFTE